MAALSFLDRTLEGGHEALEQLIRLCDAYIGVRKDVAGAETDRAEDEEEACDEDDNDLWRRVEGGWAPAIHHGDLHCRDRHCRNREERREGGCDGRRDELGVRDRHELALEALV